MTNVRASQCIVVERPLKRTAKIKSSQNIADIQRSVGISVHPSIISGNMTRKEPEN